MVFKQRSLREFNQEHKMTQQPKQTSSRNKQLKPHKAAKTARKFDKPRLPHRSRMEMQYDDEKQIWYGSLIIPGIGDVLAIQVFKAEAHALFTLANKLDEQYRKWAKQRQVETMRGT